MGVIREACVLLLFSYFSVVKSLNFKKLNIPCYSFILFPFQDGISSRFVPDRLKPPQTFRGHLITANPPNLLCSSQNLTLRLEKKTSSS
jgi:hypothetical protein